MKREIVIWLIFLYFFAMSQSANAAFIYYNQSFQTNYNAGESVKGKIMISLTNESSLSLFTSSLSGNKTLLEFLQTQKLAQGADYNCTTANCKASYIPQNIVNQFSLDGESKIGFKFNGKGITEINSASFHIESTLPASCYPQISIDVGERKQKYLINVGYTSNPCFTKNYGCFDSSANTIEAALSATPYCTNLTLASAPAYLLGAKVKNSSSGSGILKMQLRSMEDYSLLKECTLSNHVQEVEELECVVPYPSHQQKAYWACIVGPAGSSYKILSETSGEICGSDDGGASYTNDYEIFARALEFSKINMTINDSIFEKIYGEKLSIYLFDYLEEFYNGQCQPSCIVPIVFSGGAQEIKIDSVQVQYKRGNPIFEEKSLYSIQKQSSSISSGIIELEIEPAGFSIPFNAGKNLSFELFLSGSKIFPRALNFKVQPSFNFSISPTSVLVGIPNTFSLISSENISSVSWNFGDGSPEQNSVKNITHTYNEEGAFTLTITVTRKDGTTATRSFIINSGNTAQSINLLVQRKRASLAQVKEKMKAFPPWTMPALMGRVNLTALESSLNKIEQDISVSSNESSASALLSEILNLEIPDSISITSSGRASLLIGADNINAEYLADLFDEESFSSERQESIEKNIPLWMQEHYNSNMDFQIISIFIGSKKEPLATLFSLHISEKNETIEGPVYLVIDYPLEGVVFKDDYGQKTASTSASSGSAISVEKDSDFEFLVLDEVEADDLGIYLAPKPSLLFPKVSIFTQAIERWGKARVYFVLIFLITFIIYIILQEWYKKHYEKHLFKQNYELYNIVNFIYNARVSGLQNQDIAGKLKHAGWTGEQVNYAFKKIDGKRTGMYEIPIFKFLEQRKVKKELMKRQQRPIDARFIKRPFSGVI